MTATGIIYGLSGPDGIRYIGQTRRTLAARYAQHARHAAGDKQWRVCRWWRTLDAPPVSIVLEECHAEALNAREIFWIAHYRALGVDLCNHTAGGQNESPDAETRAKMSASARRRFENQAEREWLGSLRRGTTASPETRAKMSASIGAVKRTPEARARAAAGSTGRTHTQEARDRIGAANRVHMTGRTLSPEVRAKIKEANRGKKRSDETRERMRAAWVIRRAQKAQAR